MAYVFFFEEKFDKQFDIFNLEKTIKIINIFISYPKKCSNNASWMLNTKKEKCRDSKEDKWREVHKKKCPY